MLYKIKRISVFVLLLPSLWIIYFTVSILNFPVGSLSDKADVAIVLGAGVDHTMPSPVFAERIHHATQLYKTGQVGKLIFTGGIGKNKTYAESTVARNYAIQFGVDPADIYTEGRSRTTKENLHYAQQILKKEKFENVLIISDALHLKRAIMIANDLGITVSASATPTSRYRSLKTRLPFALREAYFYHRYLLLSL